MKHIKLYEHFTEEQIRSVLSKKDIKLNVSVDEIINRLNTKQENKFGFDSFIDDGGRFISDGDRQRMTDYIIKFKKLGLDTQRVEELLPDYELYHELNSKLTKGTSVEYEDEDEKESDEDEKIWDMLESLENSIEHFEEEIRKLAKSAKELL